MFFSRAISKACPSCERFFLFISGQVIKEGHLHFILIRKDFFFLFFCQFFSLFRLFYRLLPPSTFHTKAGVCLCVVGRCCCFTNLDLHVESTSSFFLSEVFLSPSELPCVKKNRREVSLSSSSSLLLREKQRTSLHSSELTRGSEEGEKKREKYE